MKYMPVLHAPDGCVKEVPFSMLCENQAQSNHRQTLDRLRERGGLGVCEMLAIIQKRAWHRMDQELAVKDLNYLLHVPNDGGSDE